MLLLYLSSFCNLPVISCIGNVDQSSFNSGSEFLPHLCSDLNKVVLTSANMELLRDSVSTLTKTLLHAEVSLRLVYLVCSWLTLRYVDFGLIFYTNFL